MRKGFIINQINLFATGINNLAQRENTQQVLVGANFLAANGSASAGAGRQSK